MKVRKEEEAVMGQGWNRTHSFYQGLNLQYKGHNLYVHSKEKVVTVD